MFKLDNIQSVMTEICEVNTENEFVRLEVVESERKLRYLLIWKNYEISSILFDRIICSYPLVGGEYI